MLLKLQALFLVLSIIIGCMFLAIQNRAGAKSTSYSLPSYQQAIERAANVTSVPSALLLCIARVESGRSTPQGLQPWPWAVNVEGRSKYFATKLEALKHVRRYLSQGITNIDVGTMQLNIKWHSQGFGSLEAMFDPHCNILYAARFLKRLRNQHGSWAKAVGAYHSSRPQRGQTYITKVAAHLTFNRFPIRKTKALKYETSRLMPATKLNQKKSS